MHLVKAYPIKGVLISEGLFDLIQSSKKNEQNHLPQLFWLTVVISFIIIIGTKSIIPFEIKPDF